MAGKGRNMKLFNSQSARGQTSALNPKKGWADGNVSVKKGGV